MLRQVELVILALLVIRVTPVLLATRQRASIELSPVGPEVAEERGAHREQVVAEVAEAALLTTKQTYPLAWGIIMAVAAAIPAVGKVVRLKTHMVAEALAILIAAALGVLRAIPAAVLELVGLLAEALARATSVPEAAAVAAVTGIVVVMFKGGLLAAVAVADVAVQLHLPHRVIRV
jgi:hypothetical protein